MNVGMDVGQRLGKKRSVGNEKSRRKVGSVRERELSKRRPFSTTRKPLNWGKEG